MKQDDFVLNYLCRNSSITQRIAATSCIEIYDLDKVISKIRSDRGDDAIVTKMIVQKSRWGEHRVASYSLSRKLKESLTKEKKKFPDWIFHSDKSQLQLKIT